MSGRLARAPEVAMDVRDSTGDECVQGLVRWLFGGELAHPSGAIAAWRDLRTGVLSYEYPESTGYFLTLASALGLTGRDVVRRGAEWLIEHHRGGERQSRSSEPGVVYTFDTVVQATGLLNYGQAERCDPAATLGARLLLDEARRVLADGDIQPLARRSRIPARPPTWSTRGRLHLVKAVQGFCLAHEATGSGAALDAAEVLVARHAGGIDVRSPQLSDAEGRQYLHPYCYALEGLWVWSMVTDDRAVATRTEILLHELREHRLPGGGMPATVGAAGAQLDVTAQAVRLGALLDGDARWLGPSLAFLRANVHPTGNGNCYVPYRQAGSHHQSSWASMFTLQAMRAFGANLNWRHLV